jgi:hypothetical protein
LMLDRPGKNLRIRSTTLSSLEIEKDTLLWSSPNPSSCVVQSEKWGVVIWNEDIS